MVRDLTFSILDIDASISNPLVASNYRDLVTVVGTGPSGTVPFVLVVSLPGQISTPLTDESRNARQSLLWNGHRE